MTLTQPYLFPARPDLREATEAWIAANPAVYAMIERAALALGRERVRFGIGHVCERIRWDSSFEWEGAFKINNNWRAYIARRLVADHPELAGKLEFRRTRS